MRMTFTSQATGRRMLLFTTAMAAAILLTLSCTGATTGSIQVNSTPAGAMVSYVSSVGGTPTTAGPTPCLIPNVLVGSYTVAVTLSGYTNPYVQNGVVVFGGVTTTVTATFGSAYTHTDDFSTNTTSNYVASYEQIGSQGATVSIDYDPGGKALLKAVGVHGIAIMRPVDAPAIQPGKDLDFGYGFAILSETTAGIYLGGIQGYQVGNWLRFALDNHIPAQQPFVFADLFINGVHSGIFSQSVSVTSGSLRMTRVGAAYTLYLDGTQVWSGTIPQLDGLSLYVGAETDILNDLPSVTAEIKVDDWNQVQY